MQKIKYPINKRYAKWFIEKILKDCPETTMGMLAEGFFTHGTKKVEIYEGVAIQAKKIITQKRGHFNE